VTEFGLLVRLGDMQRFGEICSMTERRADAASYDVVDWLKCEYVQGRVGDEFTGIVTSVTAFGLFVQLSDIYVEGLVHITALKNDYYQFDPVRHQLRGERSGVTYHLGDSVRVKVVRVDLDDRKIDLVMLDGAGASTNPEKPRASQKRGKARQGQDRNKAAGKPAAAGGGGKKAPPDAAPAAAKKPRARKKVRTAASRTRDKGKPK